MPTISAPAPLKRTQARGDRDQRGRRSIQARHGFVGQWYRWGVSGGRHRRAEIDRYMNAKFSWGFEAAESDHKFLLGNDGNVNLIPVWPHSKANPGKD